MLIEAERCFSMIEEDSTNTCTHASLFFLLKHNEPYKSSSDKLSLSIGIVAYAQVLWGQPLSKQLYTGTRVLSTKKLKLLDFPSDCVLRFIKMIRLSLPVCLAMR